MKKIIFVLTFFFISLSAFSVNWEDFSLSLEPFFALKNGQIDEYVFYKNSTYSDDKFSELNWELKNEISTGLKVQGGWKNFFQETQFSFGFPESSGYMYDSDWLNCQTANLENYQYKTHYSESSNEIEYDFSLNIKAGYDFTFFNRLHIKPALAYEYKNIKFTARGGRGWYGVDSGSYYYAYNDTAAGHRNIYTFSGKVIDYNRVANYFWVGSDFLFFINKHFDIRAGIYTAPYIYAVSYDTHYFRNVDFADLTIAYFAAAKGNLGVSYKFNEKHSICLGIDFFYLAVIRGSSYGKTSNSGYYTSSTDTEGGAGEQSYNISFSYKIKLF